MTNTADTTHTTIVRPAGPGAYQVAVDFDDRTVGQPYAWAEMVTYPADGPVDNAAIDAAVARAEQYIATSCR